MPLALKPGEMPLIMALTKELTGIALSDNKEYLVESRLSPLADKLHCSSYAQLYRMVKDNSSVGYREAFIDAMSINETSFFRDRKPFDLIKHKLVPDLLENNAKRPISIWSAACSTGQECYTIAMVLKEILFDFSNFNLKILGTDISEDAINTASRGEYARFDLLRGLDQAKIDTYFTPTVSDKCKIKDEYRSIIQFKKANVFLPITIVGTFDIVLCRNVAIYFELADKKKLFEIIQSKMKPHGILIIGATESLMGISDAFTRQEYHGAMYYTLK